jgi:peroxiredoxin
MKERSIMKRSPLYAIILSLGAAASLGVWSCQGEVQSNAQVDAPSVGADGTAGTTTRSEKAMPNFELQDLDGNVVRLSDYSGQVVLLNFWATWCSPCKAEMSDFVEIQKQYGDGSFTVIAVSLDQTGIAKVREFVDARKLNFPILMGNQTVVTQYGNFRGIPTSFLLNSDHELAKRYTGLVTKRMLESDLSDLFAG